MAKFIDAFVIPIPKKNVKKYQGLSKKAAKVYLKHGALEYRECVGDALDMDFGIPFPKLAKLKANETVLFSWIVYKSKAHRNQVNRKVMADPAINSTSEEEVGKIFNGDRMTFGGFTMLVDM